MISAPIRIFLVRIIGAISIFATSILLSKSLTIEEYGRYEVLLKISLLISSFSIFGFTETINLSLDQSEAAIKKNQALRWVSLFNISTLTIYFTINFLLNKNVSLDNVIIASSIFYSFYRILGSYLQKQKKYILTVLSDDGLNNILFIVFVSIVYLYRGSISLTSVALVFLFARFSTFIFYTILLKKSIRLVRLNNNILKKSKDFFTQTILQKIINSLPILLCSILFSNKEDVGLFSLCIRLTSIYLLLLSVYNIYMKPRISELLSRNRFQLFKEFKKLISLMSIFSVLIFVLNLIMIPILKSTWSIFNSESLIIYFILLGGLLVNLIFGVSGVMLNMSGNAKTNIQLSLIILIPYGVLALIIYFNQNLLIFSSSIALLMITENLLKYYWLRKNLLE